MSPHTKPAIWTLALVGGALGCSQGPDARETTSSQSLALSAPSTPTDVESAPAGSGQIIVSWNASPGATRYDIYRSTTAGAEGTTPHATTIGTSYLDTGLTNGPPPVYYYKVAAVNSAGTSAQSAETATPTPYPLSKGSGQVAGTSVPGGTEYYCKDAYLDGFDWFVRLNGWFPSVLSSTNAITPTHKVVDMAYASEGTMTFFDVVAPTSGLYNLDFRYAFATGLFPGVTNREMGLSVNGVVFTSHMRFPVTGNFETYQHSVLQVELAAGKNTVQQFAVTDHGVSRVDVLTVTTASASVATAPSNLTATAGHAQVSLSWTGGSGTTTFNIYRGTKFDGEAVAPVATRPSSVTSYTDTGLTSGKTYFYNVAAVNAVGVSPDSNQVSVTPQ